MPRRFIPNRLFRLNWNGTPPFDDQPDRPLGLSRETGADDIGFQQARDSNADPHVLRTTLTAFEGDLRQEPTPAERKYWQNDIAQLNEKKALAEAQAAETQGQIDAKVEENDHLEEEIEECQNGKRAGERLPSRILLIFCTVALVGALTFLFLFYPNATYSAFFADHLGEVQERILEGDTSPVSISILRSGAIGLAARKGWDTLAFCLSFPFVVVSVGLLLHFVIEEERRRTRWLLGGGVLVVAAVYDYLLAYNIEFSLWEVRKLTGIVDRGEPFSPYGHDFLAVLWLGLISYLAFSLLLFFTLRAAEKYRPIPYRRKKQEQNKRQMECLREELLSVKTVIKDCHARVRYREELLDGKYRLWWFTEAETSKLVQAWCRFIESTRHDVKPRIAKARAVHEHFLKDLRPTYTGTRNDADLGVIL